MQIINLNDREAKTVSNRDFYIEFLGMSRDAATTQALEEHEGRPSKKFVEWLTQGQMTVADGHVTTAA